jgi:hypothetical protein
MCPRLVPQLLFEDLTLTCLGLKKKQKKHVPPALAHHPSTNTKEKLEFKFEMKTCHRFVLLSLSETLNTHNSRLEA